MIDLARNERAGRLREPIQLLQPRANEPAAPLHKGIAVSCRVAPESRRIDAIGCADFDSVPDQPALKGARVGLRMKLQRKNVVTERKRLVGISGCRGKKRCSRWQIKGVAVPVEYDGVVVTGIRAPIHKCRQRTRGTCFGKLNRRPADLFSAPPGYTLPPAAAAMICAPRQSPRVGRSCATRRPTSSISSSRNGYASVSYTPIGAPRTITRSAATIPDRSSTPAWK